jgi:WD40 repeat protein/beta-lactamase regulating signal transducer with metallopeptidase domain
MLPILAVFLPAWWMQIEAEPRATVATATASRPTAVSRISPEAAAPSAATEIQNNGAMPASQPAPRSQPHGSAPQASPVAAIEPTPQGNRSPRIVADEINWERRLLTSWLIGLAGCLAYFALCQVLAIMALRQSHHDNLGDATSLMQSLASRMGHNPSTIRLRSTHRAISPMAFGLLRPVILLPRGATSWDERRLRHALIHELAHIRRHDWATQLCGQLACALYWFHPLVWFVSARMRRMADYAADDIVLSAGESAPEYAESLLSIAKSLRRSPALSSAAVPMARAGSFESRLRAALSNSKDRRPADRRWLIAILATLAVLVAPLGMIRFGFADEDNHQSKTKAGEKTALRFDQLSNGVATLFGSGRFRSDGDQYSICYSSDSQIIATGNSGSIDLFNAQTGERLKHFTTKGKQYVYETFYRVRFIDRDKRLVCSAYPDARILIWNVATGKPDIVVRAHDRNVMDLDVSPDERLIATAGDDATIRFWDASTGQKRLEIKLKNEARQIEFSSDGRELYAWLFDEHRIRRFEVATGNQLAEIETTYHHATLLPDARRIVSGDNRERIVHGLAAPYEDFKLPKTDDHATVVGCSADGRRVLALQGTNHDYLNQHGRVPPHVEIWDLEERRLLQTVSLAHVRLPQGGGSSWQFALSPDGKTLAHTHGLQIDRWNVETGEAYPHPEGHAGYVSVSFSPDGSLLATLSAEDCSLRLWDVATGKLANTFAASTTEYWPQRQGTWQANYMAWVSDSRIAAAPISRSIRIWNAVRAGGQNDRPLDFGGSSDGYLRSFAASGGQFAIARDEHIYLLDQANGKSTVRLDDHWASVSQLKSTPDGRFLASGSWDHTVVIWDMKTRSPLHVLEGVRGSIRSVSMSADGRIVAASSDEGESIVWNGQDGKVLHQFAKTSEHGVNMIAVSADGRWTALGGAELRLYETSSAKELVRVTDLDGWIGSMDFSPDGSVLATGLSRQRPVLWDVKGLLAAARNGEATKN